MSRGFVKEDDLELAGTDLPERPISAHTNYVTPYGLLQLKQRAQALEAERLLCLSGKEDPAVSQRLAVIEKEYRYFQARLESVILVEPSAQDNQTVLFGATVFVEDEEGQHHHYTIVGEDEADLSVYKVSYVSPIARALIGRKVGDSVLWLRPAGNINLEILDIHYES